MYSDALDVNSDNDVLLCSVLKTIVLEQLHTSRDSIRKAREAFLIHRGKTLEPAGLHRRDEM